MSTPAPVRYVDDAATLRVLSDPTRLAIINRLMEGAAREPRVCTAKQLAKELDEPQTKLYRHLNQLEAAGLIEVVAVRMVSGIPERHYRTAQLSLRIDEGFLGGETPLDDALRALAAVLDRHRNDLFTAIREGRVRLDPAAPQTGPFRHTIAALDATIPVEVAGDFARRLAALVEEFAGTSSDPSGVPVNMLLMFYPTG